MRSIKAILICAMILLNSGFIFAQTTKGTFLLGELSIIDMTSNGTPTTMNVGISTFKIKSDSGHEDNSDPDKEFSINLTPRLGYFILNNFAVGLDFTLAYSHSDTRSGDYIVNQTRSGIGPFLRYYIPMKSILLFTEANYAYGSWLYRWEYPDDNGDRGYQTQYYGLGLGLGIPIGNRVSFDTLLGYQAYNNKAKEDNENNVRMIVGTIGLKLGLTVFL